ncbi:hypothetical protein TH53_25470 [Pedobacter lusitanus]|uniref:Uncharacterized protein n=2 Tax=Pedobacter lusitanus TaxID=1503925 RepID=A0A0D0GEK8_9SPHI|nr:hypothetical protein TH53_25470 [Pedobacter lusitanus]
MTKGIESAIFKSKDENIYNYLLIAKAEETEADFQLSIDQNNKIELINFKRIGGSEPVKNFV